MKLQRPQIFYGWWIVSATFFIGLYMGGVVIYGFTALFEPIADEFGWSYVQISLASSLRGVEGAVMAPLMGLLADRWGPRKLIFMGGIIAASGVTILANTHSLAMFYVAFIVISLGLSACVSTVLLTAVANWFHKGMGLASGLAIAGFGFGGLMIPLIVWLIDLYQWRATMTILAIGMLFIVLPLSLLVRHKPEDYGYLPDGEAIPPVNLPTDPEVLLKVETNFRAKQALRESSFWHIAVSYLFQAVGMSSVFTHFMPYLSSVGIARSTSGIAITAMSLASVVGRLSLGWLGDKVDRRKVAAGGFALGCLGLISFGYVSTAGSWVLVLFVIFYGLGFGGANVQRGALVRQYFGRTNFGSILGLVVAVEMSGGLLGAPLTGWIFDRFGDYHDIWYVFAGFSALAVISQLHFYASTKNTGS